MITIKCTLIDFNWIVFEKGHKVYWDGRIEMERLKFSNGTTVLLFDDGSTHSIRKSASVAHLNILIQDNN